MPPTVHSPTHSNGDAPLLDKGTQLAHLLRNVLTTQSPYLLQAWPSCREATVSMRVSRRLKNAPAHDQGEEATETERRQQDDDNAARSKRRATTNVRRYCQHNGLTHMPTLTYARPADSVPEISDHLRQFRRRLLRAPWGPSEAFPYLWVPERGSEGSQRLHVHMAVGAWYTTAGCVEVCGRCATPALRAKRQGTSLAPAGAPCWGCLWRHGFVGAPSEGTDDPQALAGYVSKYVGKDLGDDLDAGRQTYRVAEGFRPQPIRLEVDSTAAAGEHLHEWAGDSELSITALHEKYPDWPGPATWTIRWEAA